jgi:CubicO group peptidase (beta-lactamase class C family)
MLQNHIGNLDVQPMVTAIPSYSNDVNLYPDQSKKWGLGFLINTKTTPEGRSAGSAAWAGLSNTYYWIDPVRDIAGVIMMQLLPFADTKALSIFSEFERAVYSHAGNVLSL